MAYATSFIRIWIFKRLYTLVKERISAFILLSKTIFVSGKNKFFVLCSGIEEHGYCQAGSSGLIFEDDLAVIGAPGSLVWRGAVFVSSVSDNFLSRDHRVYEGIRPKLRNKDAYMGKELAVIIT